jgi:hypothetical protein
MPKQPPSPVLSSLVNLSTGSLTLNTNGQRSQRQVALRGPILIISNCPEELKGMRPCWGFL